MNQMTTLQEINETQSLCKALLQTPHYQKIGSEGIFAIVSTAQSLGVDPRIALNGGLYYVKGKVEMSARAMNALIRSRKHSITKDKRSDHTVCILHGKRSDNGDTWTESFSIEEAGKAGLLRNPTWANFPKDMLFARALSRLARQLFPDLIGNCYVEGEIEFDSNISDPVTKRDPVEYHDYSESIEQALAGDADLRAKVLKAYGFTDFKRVTEEQYKTIMRRLEATRRNVDKEAE